MAAVYSIQSGRLRAAARELTSLLDQVAMIAGEGRDPTPGGAPYTPLQSAAGEAFGAEIERLSDGVRRLNELAGSGAASGHHGRAATRAALSARISRMEETVRDLHPERIQSRYGELPLSLATELEDLCCTLDESLRRARAILNSL